MGELLVNSNCNIGDRFSFKWKNLLRMKDGGYLLFLPYTKTKGTVGEYTDIFQLPSSAYCPVSAVERFKSMQKELRLYHPDNVVFVHSNGSGMTKSYVNSMLKHLLSDFCDWNEKQVTCKSFRSAIPSLLDITNSNSSSLKTWGRWSSNCFEKYTKYTREKKLLMFEKLCSDVLLNALINY